MHSKHQQSLNQLHQEWSIKEEDKDIHLSQVLRFSSEQTFSLSLKSYRFLFHLKRSALKFCFNRTLDRRSLLQVPELWMFCRSQEVHTITNGGSFQSQRCFIKYQQLQVDRKSRQLCLVDISQPKVDFSLSVLLNQNLLPF